MGEKDNSRKKPPKKIKPVGADGHRARMYNKLLRGGSNVISNRDAIEMLLYYPIKVRDTRDSAVLLMQKYKNSTYDALTAPSEELCKIEGIGPRSARFLNLIGDIAKDYRNYKAPPPAETPLIQRVSETLYEHGDEVHKGELWVLFIDGNINILRALKLKDEFDMLSKGDLYFILQRSISLRAASIVLARIADSESVFPTSKDTELMKLILKVYDNTNLFLKDYYIVGEDEIIPVLSLEANYKRK